MLILTMLLINTLMSFDADGEQQTSSNPRRIREKIIQIGTLKTEVQRSNAINSEKKSPLRMNAGHKSNFLSPGEHSKSVDDYHPVHKSQPMVKKSPGCLLWCLRKKLFHPAQCHSYC